MSDLAPVDLAPYQRILWCTDAAGAVAMVPSLSPPRIERLLVTAPDADLLTGVEAFVLRNPKQLPSVFVTRPVVDSQDPRYDRAIDVIFSILESFHRARITRQQDGFVWQQHLLRNLPAFIGRRLPASWRNALRGLPALVCGAGPSLDISIHAVKRAASAAVVFAADSALRPLAREGVQADFAVSIDVAKIPAKCLPPATPPARVVLSPLSPPDWTLAVAAESCFFLSAPQLTCDWLASLGVAPTDVLVAENCGSTAITLARYLGCAPIYLFGMDLALDPTGPSQRHTIGVDESVYSNSGFCGDRDHPTVPGNFTPQVPTFAFGDWLELDRRLAAWPGGLVFNVTDRGARIRNTTVVPPSQFTLPRSGPDHAKARATAALGQSKSEAVARAPIFGRLRAAGAALSQLHPRFEEALAAGGGAAIVPTLQMLFQDQELAQILGGFSLKLMPHLLPPIDPDPGFWTTILNELGSLAQLLQQIGS